jgi:hypothetical protein
MRRNALPCARLHKPGTAPTGFVSPTRQAPEQYRNQYQTAADRYLPIGADTHGALLEMRQNGPKMEVSGAIPTLASNFRNRNNLHAITVDSSSLLSKWARNESRPSPFVVSLRHDSLCKLLPQERVLRRSPISEKTNSKLALTILT